MKNKDNFKEERARRKFKRMYEEISISNKPNIETKRIIANYGKNLIKLFNIEDNNFEEIFSQIRALENVSLYK